MIEVEGHELPAGSAFTAVFLAAAGAGLVAWVITALNRARANRPLSPPPGG